MNSFLKFFCFFVIQIGFLLADVPSQINNNTKYPALMTGIGDIPGFPLKVAGFQRMDVFVVYDSSFSSISTGYYIKDKNIIATYYLVKKQQFKLEDAYNGGKQEIEQVHKNFVFLGEEDVVLNKYGYKYKGKRAFYKFNEKFLEKEQEVFTEFMIFEKGDFFVKLRTTTPVENMKLCKTKDYELMNSINWSK